VKPEHLGGQQHQPGVQAGQQASDERVGQSPADDSIDVVQPVLQDPNTDARRQRDDADLQQP
jgi:hypothetical protein